MICTIISYIFSFLIILIVIYVTQFYYHYFTRPNPLPGPFPLPILGNFHQIFGVEFNDWLMLMHKKYGDIFEINLGRREIVLCRPDLIENMSIPSTKTKYPIRSLITEGLIEYGIEELGVASNNNYKSWKYHRQFFIQAMMTSKFNRQTIEWTTELWEEMETYWNNIGGKLDLREWMHRFTSDIIFRTATGIKNDSVSSYYNAFILKNDIYLNEKEKEKIEESERFIKSTEIFISGFIYFISINNKYFRHYFPFIHGKIKSFLKNRDYLFGKLYNIIKDRRIEIENTPLDQPLCHDMLTAYITVNTPRSISVTMHDDEDFLKPMTDREILGNIFDAIISGTDLIASLFCFTIYYLEHYPEAKQKLREELDSVFGKSLTTHRNFDELQYCDAVIKEVYRNLPIFCMSSRVNIEKDKVGGYIWPRETSFIMHYSAIMKNKNYWTDPEKFDPDRFYKIKSDKYLLERQYVKNSFPMFGGGIRICPGRKLAVIELKCLLALIYRKYDIELVDMNAPLKYKSELLTNCRELICKIKPRKF